MKKLVKQRDLLKDALHDLENELRTLRSSKTELETKLQKDSSKLDFVKSQEIRLRNLISMSMKKEALLQKQKDKLKGKLTDVNKKIEKIRSIERELEEV
jgi:hypothetical protein